MADLFFYGTLRYLPLLELVLGKPAGSLDASSAWLDGHQVYAVEGEPFPMIETCKDAVAQGILVRGLDAADQAALDFYEGGFGYETKPLEIRLADGGTVPVDVFLPDPGLWCKGAVWDLEDWADSWGAMTLRAAREIMAYQGRISPREAAAAMPSVRRRAAAWVASSCKPQDPQHSLEQDVIVHQHKRAHIGYFAYEELDLQFRRNDGGLSPVLSRAAFMNGHASVVLPYDPLRDQVLLVEQFRAAVYAGGEQKPWMWEPVAGMIDLGETPEEAARRESVEEAGLTIEELELVGEVYPSSGCLTEKLYVYVGICDFSRRQGGGGVADEGEDIRSDVLPFEVLMERIDAHSYQDMPLVTAGLWLARHRDRIRSKYV